MNKYDVAVLGVGGAGSAALLHAATTGARTIGLDRFIAPHNHGSSHGQTRIIRQAYFEDPRYTPLLLKSYKLWNELEVRAGKKLYFESGLLQVGPADGHVVPGVFQAAKEHGLNVAPYSAQQVEAQWPALRVPPGLVAVLERHAGYLLVEECVASQLALAKQAGATLAAPCEVLGWEPGTPIHLQTTQGTIIAEKLIIAAGAWAESLLSELNLQLQVRRKSVFWYVARQPFADVPCFLYELPHGVFYGFPEISGRLKVAEHSGGQAVDNPLQYDREMEPYDAERTQNFIDGCLPGIADGLAEHQTCLYTMSPDENFIIDRHPTEPNVVFVAGLSGHGFKFVPILGKALAEMALAGGTELSLEFLSAGRFGRG